MTPIKQVIESPTDLISYFQAKKIIQSRFPDTTDAEFAMWAWLGQKAYKNENQEWILAGLNAGGFTSYFENSDSASFLDGLIATNVSISDSHVLKHLIDSKFSPSEIEAFSPSERWVSYESLLQNWAKKIGADEAKILINTKAMNHDLEPFYAFSKNLDEIESAIFETNKIELIAKSEFISEVQNNNFALDTNVLSKKSTFVPRVAIGKLTIKAACYIEDQTGRRANAKQVIELLQKWADEGCEPSYLHKSDKKKHSVIWTTDKAKSKDFTTDACSKTLEKWYRGRL